jgi:hypothetical protein
MATSKKLTGTQSNDLTSSVEATPVSLSVRQANGEVKKIRATCGRGLEKPLADYDPDTQSWRMFGDISLWGDCPLLASLPPSGMTRNGVLFLQPAWEQITGETELLSWPTPTTQDHIERKSTQQKPGSRHSVGSGDAVRMWPTPTAHPNNSNKNGKFPNDTLRDAVSKYPTPLASGGGGSGHWNKVEALFTNGHITYEEKMAMQAGNGGRLNPMWVEWLMGFPTAWTDLED